jgi:hypothetical protein
LLAVVFPACGDDDGDGGNRNRPSAEDYEIVGTWNGTLHQLGLGSFEVEAEIRTLEPEAADENTVSYTVIDCSGTWEYRGIEGNSFRFREVIDAGEGDECEGEGTVTLTPAGPDELSYSFSGGGVESRGELTAAER